MLARAMRWSLVLTLVAGCSSSRPPRSASGPVTSPTAPAGIECDGDDEVNQDDDSAAKGLLLVSQLPPGDWTLAVTPPCSWAFSGDEILAVPECRSAASAANAAPSREARNGNAHRTFSRSDGTQVDVRVEIYTSRQNVDAIRAMLVGPSAPACYAAAVRDRAEREPSTVVDDVRVAPIADLPDPAELDLGFPAVAGYAADAGFVSGVDVSLTRTTGAATDPVAMRVVTFGSGGLMTTLTLIARTHSDLDAIELTETIRAAAASFRSITGRG